MEKPRRTRASYIDRGKVRGPAARVLSRRDMRHDRCEPTPRPQLYKKKQEFGHRGEELENPRERRGKEVTLTLRILAAFRTSSAEGTPVTTTGAILTETVSWSVERR